jgi:hypothetical protein
MSSDLSECKALFFPRTVPLKLNDRTLSCLDGDEDEGDESEGGEGGAGGTEGPAPSLLANYTKGIVSREF